jgi:hypothetical protein
MNDETIHSKSLLMAERIEVSVPEGFPPMCEPVQADNRADGVFIVPATDRYLATMVRGICGLSYLGLR